MKGIGEFLSEQFIKTLPGPQAEGTGAAKTGALLVLRESIPSAESEKLASALEAFASSPEFAEAVDAAVSPPGLDESEDEFVSRAKEMICRVLMEKLGR